MLESLPGIVFSRQYRVPLWDRARSAMITTAVGPNCFWVGAWPTAHEALFDMIFELTFRRCYGLKNKYQ